MDFRCKKAMRMSDQKLNLRFVQEVEKREVLYNFNLPGYSRRDVVDKAWQEVSDEVNLPVSECKEKWRNVRTVFIRKTKPSPKGSRRRRKAYYLADAMKFCLPFIKVLAPTSKYKIQERQELMLKPERIDDDESASLEDITEISQEQDEQEEQETILPEYYESKRTKLETTNHFDESSSRCNNSEQKDAIKMFLLSLIPEVANFSDNQIKQFKRRIFNVIDEISGV